MNSEIVYILAQVLGDQDKPVAKPMPSESSFATATQPGAVSAGSVFTQA